MLEITTQIYLANFVPLIVALAKLTYIIVPAVEDSRCGLCPVSFLDQSTGDHVEKGEGGGAWQHRHRSTPDERLPCPAFSRVRWLHYLQIKKNLPHV